MSQVVQLKIIRSIQKFAVFQVKLYVIELITSNAPELEA